MKRQAKETAGLMSLLSVWYVWLFLLMAAGILAWLFLIQPLVLDQQLKLTRQTDEFVRTKQALLIRMVNDYDKLEAEITVLQKQSGNEDVVRAKRAQQVSIIDRIRIESSYIKPEYVPPEVVRLR